MHGHGDRFLETRSRFLLRLKNLEKLGGFFPGGGSTISSPGKTFQNSARVIIVFLRLGTFEKNRLESGVGIFFIPERSLDFHPVHHDRGSLVFVIPTEAHSPGTVFESESKGLTFLRQGREFIHTRFAFGEMNPPGKFTVSNKKKSGRFAAFPFLFKIFGAISDGPSTADVNFRTGGMRLDPDPVFSRSRSDIAIGFERNRERKKNAPPPLDRPTV